MKTLLNYKGLLLLAVIALSNVSFNCPQKVTILHFTSNGAQVINVSVNALSGHANHGDLYFSSFCPVSGPEWACRPASTQ